MSTKSQTVFAICFGLFLAVVVTVSLLFADKLPHATQPEGITGGYLFSFNVECVDESGKILKTQKFTGNGTLWSFEPPEVDGYTTTCASITRDDITNWRYPASHYVSRCLQSRRLSICSLLTKTQILSLSTPKRSTARSVMRSVEKRLRSRQQVLITSMRWTSIWTMPTGRIP